MTSNIHHPKQLFLAQQCTIYKGSGEFVSDSVWSKRTWASPAFQVCVCTCLSLTETFPWRNRPWSCLCGSMMWWVWTLPDRRLITNGGEWMQMDALARESLLCDFGTTCPCVVDNLSRCPSNKLSGKQCISKLRNLIERMDFFVWTKDREGLQGSVFVPGESDGMLCGCYFGKLVMYFWLGKPPF